MKKVELRQLLYFEAVVRHGGFTRAAESLHVAQPSVSTQIRDLERSLGVDLLLRTTRKVTLTAAGEQLLGRVRNIKDELDAARYEMTAHASALTGRIRIGTTAVVGNLQLPELLSRYQKSHPGIDLELSSGLVGELLDNLVKGKLDLVVGPEHGSDPRFRSQSIADERFVLITAPEDRRVISDLGQAAEDQFICLPSDSGLYQLLIDGATDSGFTPNIRVETHSPLSIRELVSCGMGVALIAESSAIGPGFPVRVHHLRKGPRHPHISVFQSTNRPSRATQALFDLLIGAATVASGN